MPEIAPQARKATSAPDTTPAQRSYRVTTIILVILLGLITYAAWWWCESSGFVTLKSVRIHGNRLLTEREIRQVIQLPRSISLLRLSPAVIRRRLESQPYVQAANVSRRFPDQLIITIYERKPFCYLALNKIFLSDSSGVVLPLPATNYKANFPIITGFEADSARLPIGKRAQLPQLQQALLFLRTAVKVTPDFYTHISEVHRASKGELIVFTTDGGTPIYFRPGDFTRQLTVIEQFQRVLQQRRTFADYQYIDLRWDKQIIVKERKF